MKNLRHGLTGLATAAALFVGFGAEKADALAVISCSELASVSDWLDGGSCEIGDKRFTIDSRLTDIDIDLSLSFGVDAGTDTYSVRLNVDGDAVSGQLAYTVDVLDPTKRIVKIVLDADGEGDVLGDDFIRKFIATADVFPPDVGVLDLFDAVTEIAVSGTSFHIVDEFRFEGDVFLAFIENRFTQAGLVDVPVPATAVLFGAGLIGLIASRRRAG